MNVIEELKKFAAEATTDHVKALLAGEIEHLEQEAKAAAHDLHEHITGGLANFAEEVRAEVAALWAKIREVL